MAKFNKQLQERKDLDMKRKLNTLKKQKTSTTNKKEEVKGKKEEVLPSTANSLSYQALYQNGLMQVKEEYFSMIAPLSSKPTVW